MAANPQKLHMTIEQYLAYDQASEVKNEYIDGEVVAMSGGTIAHSTLALNMAYLLKEQLGKHGPCRVYNSDIRVLVAQKQYVYPDVTVSCDVADYKRDNDILRSPHLVVEVLSPSTEAQDRGRKLYWYQQHPGIQEYVLINTRMQLVEIFRREQREEGESWRYLTYVSGQQIILESLDLHILVDELYADLGIPTTQANDL